MTVIQRDQVIQALAPNTSNDPLAMSIRHRASNRRLHDLHTEPVECRVHLG